MAIDPVAISLFGFDIYWYGISYVLGFSFTYWFILKYGEVYSFEKDFLEDVFLWFAIVSVVFGRVFHIIFYNLPYYLSNPGSLLAVWEGGMSIHGGFFGAFLVFYYFARKKKVSVLKISDLFTIPTMFGMALGRLANFVNQELVGRVTSSSLGVVFPRFDDQTRWPTTIFEGFKNLVIFNILYFMFIFKKMKPGIITAWGLILYNFIRFFIDFLRQPELEIGFLGMGQVLSLIFGFLGVYLLYRIK